MPTTFNAILETAKYFTLFLDRQLIVDLNVSIPSL